jgi:pSer/pThr/pTyr-binding forkhead associated (FHA) protein
MAEHWLIGIGGEVEGKTYLIGQRTITVGRSPMNQIQLTDPCASRRHCQLKMVGDRLQVIDMKSRNAFLVNGTQCQTARMAPGDELSIGEARFVYRDRANAQEDAVVGAKATGAALVRATAAAASRASSLGHLVKTALAVTDGDIVAAAKRLKITTEFLHQLLSEIDRADQNRARGTSGVSNR